MEASTMDAKTPKVSAASELLTPQQRADLYKSGLTDETIRALRMRPAGHFELEACGLIGEPSVHTPQGLPYVIPYFNLDGTPASHFRMKLLAPLSDPKRDGQKYTQPVNTPNWVYIPPNFLKVFDKYPFVLFVEGEKKAAAAIQAGYPAIGLGGVDSWRSRTFELATTSIGHGKTEGTIVVKLKPGHAIDTVKELASGVAKALPEVMVLCREHDKMVVIAFDSDLPPPKFVKDDVQRAASDLAFFFRIDGGIRTASIRQLRLPLLPGQEKTGLDDFLVELGPEALQEQLNMLLAQEPRKSYPRRPQVVSWMARKLNAGRLSRIEIEQVCIAAVAELDARGRRLTAPGHLYYYFDEAKRVVMPAVYVGAQERLLTDASFAQYLYTEYGLRTRDLRVREGLMDAYTAEQPIERVEPHKGLRIRRDAIDFQLGNSTLARVTADTIRIEDNGSEGTLFLADQVEEAGITQEDVDKYLEAFGRKPLAHWWKTIFTGLNIQAIPGLDRDESIEVISTLMYVSPWLQRWRGTQLPLEIACAEAGSGKSSTYSLRLQILTGRPELKNVPGDLRDWYAAISASPCMWVGDNVRFASRDIRQRLSDELCRLITEPEPQIVLRRLYTTSETARIPVNTTFAVTSIYPPFQSADLQQRSITINFQAIPEGERQGNWVETQLSRFGGRKMWILHHLDALRRFMKFAQMNWDPNYKSFHRLANLEQSLLTMGQVLGAQLLTPSCLRRLASHASDISDDTTMSGLVTYAAECAVGHTFTAGDVVAWAQVHPDYQEDIMLTNARRLGRHILAHEYDVKKKAGIVIKHKYQNRTVYAVENPPLTDEPQE